MKCSKDAGELRVKCRKDAGKEQEKCKRNGEADFMAEDYIWTENMTVGYGKTPLIRQIGIHVRAGEIVTLIGPNGAGKSTILRSVIRQLGLLEGTVYLDGMPMKGMGEREIAKRMSILMTERIHPELMNRPLPIYRKDGHTDGRGQRKGQGGHGNGPCVGSCFPGFFADKRRAEAAHSSGPGRLSGPQCHCPGRAHLLPGYPA